MPPAPIVPPCPQLASAHSGQCPRARVLAALLAGATTAIEICRVTGLARSTVYQRLVELEGMCRAWPRPKTKHSIHKSWTAIQPPLELWQQALASRAAEGAA